MLKYDQNVPLNKQSYLYRSYQYFGRSATSHYLKNTVNIDRLYSWMGHHTVLDKQSLLLLHPTVASQCR